MISNTEHNNRVVIAEDSQTQAEKLKYALENLGLEVYHGKNGKLALDLIKQLRPVMIISDAIMPELDGFELGREVKSDDELKSTPFIMLTSLSDLNFILKGLECRADNYIMKPFNEQYLLSRLNQVMENKDLPGNQQDDEIIEIEYDGINYKIQSNATQILNLLFSCYESAVYRNIELEDREKELLGMNEILRKKVERRKQGLNKELQQIIEAEKTLKSSEEKFRDLVDNALVGIYISSVEGDLMFCNGALRDMLEYDSIADLLRVRTHDLFEDPSQRKKLIEILKKNRYLTEYETRMVSKNGNKKDALINAYLEGEYISGMILDISERKEAEKRMKKFREQLVISKEKAERSESLKNAFLANMSNEILNPLNSLIGFTELIGREDVSSSNLLAYSDQINESGNHLINTIENIIDIAKVESGELKIKKSECDINKMLLDLYAECKQVLVDKKKSNIEFILKRESKDVDFAFITESYRLKRILTNLLSNSIKYTDQGVIEFGYTILSETELKKNDQIQFYVKDTGSGISQEKLTLLFDRFRESNVSYTKLSEGAGLGLPLTRAYVELLDGKIWCKSEPGKGTEFYFTLPFSQGESVKQKIEKRIPAHPVALRENLKILIAEDISSNYLLLEALLSEIKPSLIWAKNGQEAVESFKKEKDIDLILMDLRMPVMSGYEAVAEIRKLDDTIPIIVQTAFAREEDKQEILDLGCNSFLTKPIKQESLFTEIENLVYKK